VPAAAPRPPGPPGPPPEVTVYGYHPYWSPDPTTLDYSRLSHLAIFNVDLEADGTVSHSSRWTSVAEGVLEKAAEHDVKVHLCVTGFDDDVLNEVLPSDNLRATLVSELSALVNDYGAHGVNVDFEGMDSSNKEHLVSLVVELKAEVDEVFLATPAVDWSGAYDYDQLAAHSDGLFIMGYGYHWKGGNPGPVAPLFGGDPWSKYSLDWTVQDYVDNGASHDKIILGLPLYGNEWPSESSEVPGTATEYGWAVVMTTAMDEAETYGHWYDEITYTPYTFPSGTQLWYDDPDSVRDRISWAVDSGLQGVGFWALGYEPDDGSFWEMVTEETTSLDGDTGDPGDTGETGETGSGDGDPPVALAGASFLAYPGETIVLDGSGSYDPEGGTLSYQWSQVGGPEVTLSKAQSANPRFDAKTAGTHSFELAVEADGQRSDADVIDVVVVNPGIGNTLPAAKGCSVAPSLPLAWVYSLGLLIGLRRRS